MTNRTPLPRAFRCGYNWAFRRGCVGEVRWFYRSDEEWTALAERLKLTPCPHCKEVGALIRHGYLYGFDETIPGQKTLRARRVFCSTRNAHSGCGRTFSVWLADKIRRLSLTTGAVWRFVQRAAATGIVAAIRAADGIVAAIRAAVEGQRSNRTWYRVWQRFNRGQSKIRTALHGRCPPPELPPRSPPEPLQTPAAQVLAHLQAAFPNVQCPIAAFQHSLRTFFV